MNKIRLIIAREFNQRVRKRTFILTTLLTPLLMIGLIAAPVLIQKMEGSSLKEILVLDQSGVIALSLQDDTKVRFTPTTMSEQEIRSESKKIYGYLVVGADIVENPANLQLYTFAPASMEVEQNISKQVKALIEDQKLNRYQIENLQQILSEVKTQVSLSTYQLNPEGGEKASSSSLSMMISLTLGLLTYIFIFTYGIMVMQGVIEEKSSKVLELIVSSVRPFELMMGKIVGIGLVAMMQFLIWGVLIFLFSTLLLPILGADALSQSSTMAGGLPAGVEGMGPKMAGILQALMDPGYLLHILSTFLLFFIGGYLLYAALFAAVGSTVESVQDSQQLQIPVTIPLLLATIVAMTAWKNPDAQLVYWFSLFPFTSPIVMPARIPYDVPTWQMFLSVLLLFGTFLVMVWVAGKIYRTGILMTGKKVGFGELYKWIKYK